MPNLLIKSTDPSNLSISKQGDNLGESKKSGLALIGQGSLGQSLRWVVWFNTSISQTVDEETHLRYQVYSKKKKSVVTVNIAAAIIILRYCRTALNVPDKERG